MWFPVWWYTTGTMKVLRMVGREAQSLGQTLNLRVLFKFLFKPMFGQTGVVARIISVCVRIVHFCILTVYSVVVMFAFILLLIVWLLLPLFLVYEVWFNLFGTAYVTA